MRKLFFAICCFLFLGSSLYLLAAPLLKKPSIGSTVQSADKAVLQVKHVVQTAIDVKAGDWVQRASLQRQTISVSRGVADDFLADLTPMVPRPPLIFSRDLKAGSILKKTDILRPQDPGYVAGILAQNRRAKPLTITNLSQFDGLVHQGDAVDILFHAANGPPGQGHRALSVQPFIRNATIIGPVQIGRKPNSHENNPGPKPDTLLFALSMEDAVRASLAEEIGTLSIVLRRSGENDGNWAQESPDLLTTVADLVTVEPEIETPMIQQALQYVRVMRGSDLSTISVPSRLYIQAK